MFGNAWETLFCSGVLPAAACAGSPLAHTTTAAGAPVLSKTDFLGETFPFFKKLYFANLFPIDSYWC